MDMNIICLALQFIRNVMMFVQYNLGSVHGNVCIINNNFLIVVSDRGSNWKLNII